MAMTYLALSVEPSNQILNNILYEFKNNFELKGDKKVTKTTSFLENHINTTFEFFDKVKTQEVAATIINFVWLWLFYYFMFAKRIL